jgi:MIP family channel proteins
MTLFVFFGCGSFLSTGAANNMDYDGGSSNNTARVMPIAMNFGIGAVVLLYCTHGISGGHMNPAVTVFMMICKQMTPARGAGYIAAQLLGGIIGCFLLWACTTETGVHPYLLGANHLLPEMSGAQGFLLEIMGTLLLCLAILFTEVMKGGPTDGKPNLSLLIIGLSIFVAHVALVPFTGCGINPARTFGPALVGTMVDHVDDDDVFFGEDAWIYYLGPLVGAVIASGFYFILYEEPQPRLTENSRQGSEL